MHGKVIVTSLCYVGMLCGCRKQPIRINFKPKKLVRINTKKVKDVNNVNFDKFVIKKQFREGVDESIFRIDNNNNVEFDSSKLLLSVNGIIYVQIGSFEVPDSKNLSKKRKHGMMGYCEIFDYFIDQEVRKGIQAIEMNQYIQKKRLDILFSSPHGNKSPKRCHSYNPDHRFHYLGADSEDDDLCEI